MLWQALDWTGLPIKVATECIFSIVMCLHFVLYLVIAATVGRSALCHYRIYDYSARMLNVSFTLIVSSSYQKDCRGNDFKKEKITSFSIHC